jgi:hypothetical protein
MRLILAAALSFSAACAYEETALNHVDLKGKVRIPAEALNLQMLDPSTNEEFALEGDPRAMGPVYLGLFPSVVEGLYPYPHPEQGPVLDDGADGNTYPYGGTTIGRFDMGCYRAMSCKTVTGRYADWDDVLDFFENQLRSPIYNTSGEVVSSGVELQERCFETQGLTSDAEVSFIGPVDFELKDGMYEADVTILHSLFVEGMSVWGWVDMPSRTFDFATCDSNGGPNTYYYDEGSYYAGSNYQDVLNFPGKYIEPGDWVGAEGVQINKPEDEFVLELGFKYE